MWWMIGLLAGDAQAGDVWLVLDDAKRRVEVPAEWFVSDGGSARLRTAVGDVDLSAEVPSLRRAPVGAKRAWPLADGTLTLEHRADPVTPATEIGVALGNGLTLSMELGEAAGSALGPIQASVAADGLTMELSQTDLLAPLRRAPPTTLFRGTDKRGRPVVVEVR